MSPDQDDLAKRSKALDLREALLDQRARELDETEATSKIDVLTKQITAKEAVLEKLQDEILSLDKKLPLKREAIKDKLLELDAQIAAKQKFLSQLDDSRKVKDSELTELKARLHEIKLEISDSKQYLKEQEELVNTTIAEWNVQLNGLQQEAESIHLQKRKALEDSIRLEQDNQVVRDEIDKMQQRLSELDLEYETKSAEYQNKQAEAEKTLTSINKAADELALKQELRERDLVTREKSVKVREVMLKQSERDMAMKERKLRMDFNLAGENYDE